MILVYELSRQYVKANFLWLSICIFFSMTTFCVQAGPKIQLDEYSYDFGRIDRTGEVQKHVIEMFNVGDEDLEIKFMGASCGCLDVEQIDEKILPGEGGYIVLVIDPLRIGTGLKTQTLLLNTNDPQKEQVTIYIHYKAKLDEVAISPVKVNVELSKEDVRKSTGQSKNTIIVVDTWDKRLEIVDIQSSPNLTTSFYDILYRCPLGSEVHLFRFETKLSPTLPVGPFAEWITFTTDHPDYPFVTVPISGNIASGVKLIPQKLFIRNVEMEKQITKSIKVELSNKSERLEIGSIYSKDKWLKVEQIKIDEWTVMLKVNLDFKSIRSFYTTSMPKFIKSQIQITIKKPDEEKRLVDILCVF